MVASQTPGRAVIELRYPEAVENEDLTWRPKVATRIVIERDPGDHVEIAPGELHDRYGNRNANALTVEL